jgi:hypothetical protein
MTPEQIRREDKINLAWLAEFRRAAGRPLRVLHIGNIANNGYNNAKLQRKYGIEADAICNDYYHVTGTPEWESAEFEGEVDTDLPDWWSVDFKNWRRPDWFIQGPLRPCLDYLRARQSRCAARIQQTRYELLNAHWKLLKDSARLRGVARGASVSGAPASAIREWGSDSWWRDWSGRVAGWRTNATSLQSLADTRTRAIRLLRDPALRRRQSGQRLGILDRLVLFVRPAPVASVTASDAQAESTVTARITIGVKFLIRTAICNGVRMFEIAREFSGANRQPQNVAPEAACTVSSAARRERALGAIRAFYLHQFSEVPEAQSIEDLNHAELDSAQWTDVLDYYDIVQGYSTAGYIPLFNGFDKYTAYEHGTIRVIPFENDTRGRLCWLTYKLAPRVFVTNSDVLGSADRIGIARDRIVYLPHAFDASAVQAFRDANPMLKPPPGPVILFCPARHHWRHGDGSWLKGNDVFLRAAGQLAAAGATFSMILVEWGQEVELSKALIADMGYAHLVKWVPLKRKTELWKAYCQAHAIVDQFALPAIGGATIEALAMGVRVITRIDTPTLQHFFGAAPPVLNCATVQQVADRIADVIADPDDKSGIGPQGRVWINTYHSAERLVAKQSAAYRALIDGKDGLHLSFKCCGDDACTT